MNNSTNSTVEPQLEQGVHRTVLATFYLLLSIYVIITNLIEIVIITRIKTSSSTIFIASLALTDLTMGTFAILPSSISFLLHSHDSFFLGAILCDISGLVTNTSLFASLLSVLCITLNRYIALALPLQYKKISTNQVAYSITGVVWLGSLIRSLTPYYKLQRYIFVPQIGMCSYFTNALFNESEKYYYPLLQVVPYSICFVLLIFCPLHMTVLLSKRQRHGHSASTRSSSDSKKSECEIGKQAPFSKLRPGSLKISRSRSRAKQNEREATTTTLLVVIGFVVCYAINYFFICYYFGYLVLGNWPFTIPDKPYTVLETCWMLGINLNSVFNPIIYLFRNTAFKTELLNMKQALEKICRCSSDGVAHKVMRGGTTSSGSCSYKS